MASSWKILIPMWPTSWKYSYRMRLPLGTANRAAPLYLEPVRLQLQQVYIISGSISMLYNRLKLYY